MIFKVIIARYHLTFTAITTAIGTPAGN